MAARLDHIRQKLRKVSPKARPRGLALGVDGGRCVVPFDPGVEGAGSPPSPVAPLRQRPPTPLWTVMTGLEESSSAVYRLPGVLALPPSIPEAAGGAADVDMVDLEAGSMAAVGGWVGPESADASEDADSEPDCGGSQDSAAARSSSSMGDPDSPARLLARLCAASQSLSQPPEGGSRADGPHGRLSSPAAGAEGRLARPFRHSPAAVHINHAPELLRHLAALQHEHGSADVVLVAAPPNQRSARHNPLASATTPSDGTQCFYVHSFLWRARCDFDSAVEALDRATHGAPGQSEDTRPRLLVRADPAALEAVVRYVYTGEARFARTLAPAVHELARLFGLEQLAVVTETADVGGADLFWDDDEPSRAISTFPDSPLSHHESPHKSPARSVRAGSSAGTPSARAGAGDAITLSSSEQTAAVDPETVVTLSSGDDEAEGGVCSPLPQRSDAGPKRGHGTPRTSPSPAVHPTRSSNELDVNMDLTWSPSASPGRGTVSDPGCPF